MLGANTLTSVKLLRGSHIVVPRLYDGDHAHILQASDNRFVLVIRFEGTFSLIGTTDVEVDSEDDEKIDEAGITYLCDAVNRFLKN